MPVCLAIAAHPDDIEFLMAGTMLHLADAGWDLHYFNIANGCYGSQTTDATETARIRLAEAEAAAKSIGATFHRPICDDMHIFYNAETLHQVAAVVRSVNPQIVLTHSTIDYMEDHTNAARLAVSATFIKASFGFQSVPARPPVDGPVAVYHAQPHGNSGPLLEPIRPHFLVDIENKLQRKSDSLSCHRSQEQWLQATQNIASLGIGMEAECREIAHMGGGQFAAAEGWRRHLHFGFGPKDFDPLTETLEPMGLIQRVDP